MGSGSGSASQQDEIKDIEVVEREPTGRYVRYEEIISESSSKTVYKGFDEVNGIEIAWSKIYVSDKAIKSKENLDSLCAEASLLKSLKHENIMRCYLSWFDREDKTIHMITEVFTSGNLGQYRKKHNVDNKAIKNWARQILRGLDYLHCHDPPIINHDLKCENIFVNGNNGRVKIGVMGLSLILEQGSPVHSFEGTPEFMPFMAPELFEEDYNQLVDIYSFGMCLLQMVTREVPYSECCNSVQVHEKASSSVMPVALSKVTDTQVKQLIEKCLAPASERPTAMDLLNEPVLAPSLPGTFTIGSDLSLNLTQSLGESVGSSPFSRVHDQMTTMRLAASPVESIKNIDNKKRIYTLRGNVNNNVSILMTLWIGDYASDGFDKFEFEFAYKTDTILSLMEEMAKDLGLSTEEIALVSELMQQVLAELVPGTGYCSLLSSLAEGNSNLQNIPAEKLSCDVNHDALQQPLYESGEQDPRTVQLASIDRDSVPLDQGSLSTQSSVNRSPHNKVAKQEQHGKYKSAGSGNINSRKEEAKSHSCGLRKLFFLCNNKISAQSESFILQKI